MNDFFRKEAMDSFSSRSDMYRPVKALTIRRKIIILMLLVCTISSLVWVFFGTIYETIIADGIVGYSYGDGGVYTETDGILTKRMVSIGDTVKPGDILAIIPSHDILDEIEAELQNTDGEMLESLYDKYDHYSVLRSNTRGIVTYIEDENSWVSKGDMIAYVTRYDEEIDSKKLTAFVPSSKKELIGLNMTARVMPDYAPSEEYGYINAYVSAINNHPVSGEEILSGDQNIHPELIRDESYVKVEITMLYSEKAKNHLSWSNSMGESLNVTMGTSCSTDIIIRECTPFEWLMGGKL